VALQGILLSSIVVIWCLLYGLIAPSTRILRFVTIAGILLLCSFVSRYFLARTPEIRDRVMRYAEEFYFFSSVVIVTALLWSETRSGYLTAAWAIQGVMVFVSAILLKRRAYRLLGLGLLLICCCKILLIDVWQLATLPRIVTFIVLGVSLVLISFLYTKYKETWRKMILGNVT
jgi:hypothetical protein